MPGLPTHLVQELNVGTVSVEYGGTHIVVKAFELFCIGLLQLDDRKAVKCNSYLTMGLYCMMTCETIDFFLVLCKTFFSFSC